MPGKTGVPKGLYYYKVHTAVDAKSRIILDPHVTPGNVSDGKKLLERIDFLEESRANPPTRRNAVEIDCGSINREKHGYEEHEIAVELTSLVSFRKR